MLFSVWAHMTRISLSFLPRMERMWWAYSSSSKNTVRSTFSLFS